MSDLVTVPQPAMPPPDTGYPSYGAADEYGSSGPSASPVRLLRMLRFLLKFWWIPILTVLMGVGFGFLRVRSTPPTFTSTALMWETEKLRLPGGASFTEDVQNYYGTQMELLQSERMFQLAIESLQTTGTNNVPRDKTSLPLKVKVKARQQPKSTVIVLEASSSDPQYAQNVLEKIMVVFQAYRRSVRQNVSSITVSSISDSVKKIEGDLRESQAALATFQKSNNLAILQQEATISGGYLAKLKTELSDLQLEYQLLETSVAEPKVSDAGATNAVSLLHDPWRPSAPTTDSATAQRQTAQQDLELLKIQRQKLSEVYKPKHPKMVKLEADIERAEKIIAMFREQTRNQTREQLASAQQSIKMRMDNIRASIKEWATKVIDEQVRIAEAEHLRQNVARSQGLYDRLDQMLQNVDLSRSIDQDTLAILEHASPAIRTYKQDITILSITGILALVVGIGLVLLIEFFDDRFTSPQEVTAKFGDAIVGLVPEVKALTEKLSAPATLEQADPHLFAEAYRSLRSALFYMPVESVRPKVLLVTSALPGEGKSTVAANLARTIALGGSRVLLVDADLRQGQVHHQLGLKAEPGLAELLGNHVPIETVRQTNCLANFTFIARGKTKSHPGDMFLSDAFQKLLLQWRQEFDYVLIDSCPVLAADDVATLAPRVDGTLFVVRQRFSRSRSVRDALELLSQRQAKVLGLVFNRADVSARSSYYYQGYAAAYAAGEGTKGPKA